ncbi:MAG: hypothetical protein AAF772_21450, partial [Acidobacteriota bacterium]
MLAPIASRTTALAAWLFAAPHRFVPPYLLVYLAGHAVGAGRDAVVLSFQALHVALLLLGLIACAAAIRRSLAPPRATLRRLVPWTGLALLFVVPGAYLEFPSDPIEHLQRIFVWSRQEALRGGTPADRFVYLFGYSLLGPLPFDARPRALRLYAAFWPMLLALQLWWLARRGLGLPRGWSWVLVASTIALLGIGPFAFFRLYALAAAAPAYLGYLAVLTTLCAATRARPLPIAPRVDGPILIALMAVNHLQALMFTAAAGLATALRFGLARRPWTTRALLAVGFAGGVVWGVLRGSDARPWAARAAAERYIAPWGGARIWAGDPELPYLQAWGVAGLLTLFLALAAPLWAGRRARLIAALTLTPPLLLLWPPFVALFHRMHGAAGPFVTFRILYAAPASLLLVLALRRLTVVALRRRRGRSTRPAVRGLVAATLAAALIALAAAPDLPWRGRGWHLLVQPASTLTLDASRRVAAALIARGTVAGHPIDSAHLVIGNVSVLESARRQDHLGWLRGHCFLATDGVAAWGVGAHLGLYVFSHRRQFSAPRQVIRGPHDLRRWIDRFDADD